MTARPYVGTPGSAAQSTPTPSTPSTSYGFTPADLAATLNLSVTDAEGLYAVGVNEIEAYAPLAPGPNKTEALRRFLAYIVDAEPGTKQSETFGPKSIDFTTNHSSAFKNCGAAMLLTRYRKRRAGSI